MGDYTDTQDDEPPADGSARTENSDSIDRAITATRDLDAWRQRPYRVVVVALGALGILMGVGGIVFTNARTVLFALAGIGMFGAVLLYALVPERFVTASLGSRTYAPLAEIGPLLVDTLELPDQCIYLPTNGGHVRLFVPEDETSAVPKERSPAVGVNDDGAFRGAVLPTTGDGLLAEFHDRSDRALASDAEEALAQLLDVLVEEFELVEEARGRASPAEGRATIAIEGSHYGPVDAFDHPVAAFLAAGLAVALDTAVTLDPPRRDEYGRYVVTCRWREPTAAADDRTWPRGRATEQIGGRFQPTERDVA